MLGTIGQYTSPDRYFKWKHEVTLESKAGFAPGFSALIGHVVSTRT
jgi:hypothetical protein